MGKISDAIADVEDELECANDRIKELEGEVDSLAEERDEYKEEFKRLQDYVIWAEDFYPDMATQYGAIQKVRG